MDPAACAEVRKPEKENNNRVNRMQIAFSCFIVNPFKFLGDIDDVSTPNIMVLMAYFRSTGAIP